MPLVESQNSKSENQIFPTQSSNLDGDYGIKYDGKKFCKTVEYICSDNRFWVLETGSFNEIVAYLDGYSWGAGVNLHGHHSFSTPFGHWLAIKFSSEENIVGWKEYRKIFPEEKDAILNLPVLYREFAESKHLENLGY